MVYREYERLTQKEREYYNIYLEQMQEFAEKFEFPADADRSSLRKAYYAVKYDHPEIFYYDYNIASYVTSSQNVIVEPYFWEGYDFKSAPKDVERFNAYIDEILAHANEYDDEYNKVLFIHNYIVYNTKYSKDPAMRYNAFGCIVEHEAVCIGYAAALKVLLNRLDIECGIVRGRINNSSPDEPGHAWNYVNLNGKNYFFDPTWDDPAFINTSKYAYDIKYNYYAVDKPTLSRTHTVQDKNFVPDCYSMEDNYFRHFGFYCIAYSFEQVDKITAHQAKYRKDVRVQFGSLDELRKANYDLFAKGKWSNLSCINGDSFTHMSDERHYTLTFLL